MHVRGSNQHYAAPAASAPARQEMPLIHPFPSPQRHPAHSCACPLHTHPTQARPLTHEHHAYRYARTEGQASGRMPPRCLNPAALLATPLRAACSVGGWWLVVAAGGLMWPVVVDHVMGYLLVRGAGGRGAGKGEGGGGGAGGEGLWCTFLPCWQATRGMREPQGTTGRPPWL